MVTNGNQEKKSQLNAQIVNHVDGIKKMKKEIKYDKLQDDVINMLFKENCELKIQNNQLTDIIKQLLKEKWSNANTANTQ